MHHGRTDPDQIADQPVQVLLHQHQAVHLVAEHSHRAPEWVAAVCHAVPEQAEVKKIEIGLDVKAGKFPMGRG